MYETMKNKIYKIALFTMPLFGMLGTIAHAEDYTTETIASATGGVLNTTVQSIITVGISFLTANLPLIVVLGVAVGMVFWLIRKTVRAIRGK
jgi:hypothetical protein